MPFRSEAQKRWVKKHKPALAKKWGKQNKGVAKGNTRKRKGKK